MEKVLLEAEMPFKVEFYDVDTMGVVWHGNYIKYMEAVRCVLLDKIGYGYSEMMKEGFAFPVITINLKYVRSLVFGENAVIKAYLLEYKDRLRIKYEVFNSAGMVATKGETVQIAVDWNTKETQFESPELFVQRVEETIGNEAR
ncbi:MAG: acyl-CoA thioesterase [Treponema porcinum]|uniref:acyl-CoA thioesterase n=1 Tax=Treponema porcinum TaxID=261392 RepID=UPI0023525E45|nr:acyl-CoA thioesterase [Treponema porcinum]MCI6816024.1 acyl-CoA thioesterase [Treponema porcinum]MCI6983840.1 acyl-CoA thioesterase [Treponema porcinum]MCI7546238.1 acyl-CoA thioesterase [Treponema porcinum]MDD6899916.1 acyl-CoA thioesterase [Treponema porcinum]MDY4188867.1 acyl-CoA thioesterase [Treponema porcinum]